LLFTGRFSREAVTARIVAAPRPTTEELDAEIERRWRAAVAAASRDGRDLWDGALLRFVSAATITVGDSTQVELEVAPGRYRDFAATNLAPDLRPADRGGLHPWSHFGNAVGTSALIVTGDRVVVAGRRSDRVFGLPRHLHCFGGMLEPDDWTAGAATVDVFSSMERELAEELGVARNEWTGLWLLGLLREPLLDQPELLFAATTALDRDQVGRRFATAPSNAEHAALIDLPREAAARVAVLRGLPRVTAVTRVASRLLGDV
jgi:hypothetical protein